MGVIPIIVIVAVFTYGFFGNRKKDPIIVPDKTEQKSDSKSGLDDSKAVIDSKDSKVVIEEFPVHDVMDRWVIDFPPPPVIHPPCVTEVNPCPNFE